MNLYALIMAGGQGTRFWPESTPYRPKQYLSLVEDRSLLESTIDRLAPIVAIEHRWVVTIKAQESLAREHSGGKILPENFIFEPIGRNTAPCILLSLAVLLNKGASKEDVVAIAPSDHFILNSKAFGESMLRAAKVASKGERIVTIGIVPTAPHTGYGYIRKGEELESNCFVADAFKEKPDLSVAQDYLSSGNYYWNGGIFVASIATFISAFKECCPQIYGHFAKLSLALSRPDQLAKIYAAMPTESIDYGVMEKFPRVVVIPASFDWSDLGSWEALEKVAPKRDKNTTLTAEKVYFDQAEGNIIYAPGRTVALVGVSNLVVVVSEKALLVIPKEDSQQVKKIVAALEGE